MKRFLKKLKCKIKSDKGQCTGYKEVSDPSNSNQLSTSTQPSSGPASVGGRNQDGTAHVLGGTSHKPGSREELRELQARAATERREQDRLRGNLSEKVAQRLETDANDHKVRKLMAKQYIASCTLN